ncbi:MAG: hypothetical protein ACI80P_001292, partial [Flavobacteriales bacterium]
ESGEKSTEFRAFKTPYSILRSQYSLVELAGVEPASKQGKYKVSTCLSND